MATTVKKPKATAKPVKTAAKKATVTKASKPAPSREQIEQLAKSYWEARGCQGGSPEEDWARAEKELKSAVK